MKWDKHIEYLTNKTKYLLFIFHKLSKIMKIETLRTIYCALFNSIISYGIIAWGGAYANVLSLLQNLQKRLLKIINKNNFIIDRNPLSIGQLYALESLYYHYNNLQSKYQNSNSKTRNKSIQIPTRYKTVSIKSSLAKAISLFNSLPNELKNLQIKDKKKKLKIWIMHNV